MVDLRWSAPPECPDVEHVRRHAERHLGRAWTDVDHPEVAIDAVVERDAPHGWRLRIRVLGPTGDGEREIVGDDCEELADAAGLVVALAVDHELASVMVPEAPAPVMESVREDAVASTERRDAVAAPRPTPSSPAPVQSRRRPRGHVRIGGAFGVGALPRATGSLAAAAGVSWPRAVIEVAVGHWFARELEAPVGRARVSLTTGAVQAGPRWRVRAFEIPLRFGIELGVLRGEGLEIESPRRPRQLWAAAVGALGFVWVARSWLALEVDVGAAVPLVRYAFTLGGEPAFTVGSAAFRAGLALEFRFP
jgi:hypothetical protein